MKVRVLSEWAGSGPCGSVCDVADAIGSVRIATGWAERVDDPRTDVAETHVVLSPVETAVRRGRPRKVS